MGFIKKQNNTISGIVADPAIKALDKLNINYTLHEEPLKNQIVYMKTMDSEICAIGWFKNDEMNDLVNYSDSIYKDKPLGIITQKKYKIEENTHIDKFIKERK